MATRAIEPFSGGEKTRLALALLIRTKPNLLLLDEPTNHLDLEMREALTFAMQDYEGGMVFVSHDRHLLRTCADELLLVADGKVTNSTATSTTTPPGWPPSARRKGAGTRYRRRKGRAPQPARRSQGQPAGRAGPAPPAAQGNRAAGAQAGQVEEEKAALDAQFADPSSTPRSTG
jgi:ATP-binding cassette subfamily F protein 3